MPGLNFDYTKFLREQNEKYIKKYGDDPIKADANPQPIIGYSGHVPSYRGSIHELRVVRSLVRCVSSPMKPTTATGYRSKSRQFYRPEDEDTSRRPSTKASLPSTTDDNAKVKVDVKSSEVAPDRIRSAPAAISRERDSGKEDRPRPSDISMMAAGSSALLKDGRPRTAAAPVINQKLPGETSRSNLSTRRSTRSSASSLAPLKIPEPPVIPKRPTGYPQTLYGSSYWYAWPGDTPRPKGSKDDKRPDSFDRDRRLNRKDGVLYHKHEGMVPKYLGYVPSYKFRHGSTFGVLTVNATSHGLAHRLLAK